MFLNHCFRLESESFFSGTEYFFTLKEELALFDLKKSMLSKFFSLKVLLKNMYGLRYK